MLAVFVLVLLAAFAVGATDVEPCSDGVLLLLGPWTALVGMQHPQQDEAETGYAGSSDYSNYAAHAGGAWTCCAPPAFAFAVSAG